MIWWISGGIVVAAVVFFAVVVLGVLARLREVRHVARALQRRLADARTLEGAVDDLRQRAQALQEPLVDAQERAALIQARRGGDA